MQLNLNETSVQALINGLERRVDDLTIDVRQSEADVEFWRNQYEMEGRARDAEDAGFRTRIDTLYEENRQLRFELQYERAKQLLDTFDWSTLNGLDFIPAIKELRERTGLGLKEAKECVERAVQAGTITLKNGYIPQALRDVETPS